MSKTKTSELGYCEIACGDLQGFLLRLTDIRFVSTNADFGEGEVAQLDAKHPKHGRILVSLHGDDIGSWGYWTPWPPLGEWKAFC